MADLRKEKEIKTEYLTIKGNCLELPERSIQLSNISMFSTAKIDAPSLWFVVAAVVLALFGFETVGESVSIGLLLLLVGVALGVYWYSGWRYSQNAKRLSISMNSGQVYSITFEDRNFLDEVESVIKAIIRDPNPASNVIFDLKNSTFHGSVIGENGRIMEMKH